MCACVSPWRRATRTPRRESDCGSSEESARLRARSAVSPGSSRRARVCATRRRVYVVCECPLRARASHGSPPHTRAGHPARRGPAAARDWR
eukprot:3971242-Prymnesium_polylepis.1